MYCISWLRRELTVEKALKTCEPTVLDKCMICYHIKFGPYEISYNTLEYENIKEAKET